MRKITLILMSLCLALGAVAQTPITHDKFDANRTYRVFSQKSGEEVKAWSTWYGKYQNWMLEQNMGSLESYDKSSREQEWEFVPGQGTNDGKYLIRNVSENLYMKKVEGNAGVALTSNINEAVYYTIIFNDENETLFKFNCGEAQINNLYNDGGGKLCGWTNGTDEWFSMEFYALVDYSVNNQNSTHSRYDRILRQISINGIDVFDGNNTSAQIYQNKTSKIIEVNAGDLINIYFDYGGYWMHRYVYIDEQHNGFEYGVADNGYTPLYDLKSYSYYKADEDAIGYNSAGQEITGDAVDTETRQTPSFTAPTVPGEYRMRFKVDWNSLDPKGSASMVNDGGAIVDITLKVVAADIQVKLTPFDTNDNLLTGFGDNSFIGTFSAPYATTIPEGVTAYCAQTGGGNIISLTSVSDVVPANFGVVLVADKDWQILDNGKAVVTMSPSSEAGNTSMNNVLGNTASGPVVMQSGDYILTRPSGYSAGFYPATGTLAANKAYLRLGNTNTSALRLVVDETTVIENVVTEKANGAIYDLTGRRVLNTVKGGVYIQNGKKFIVK